MWTKVEQSGRTNKRSWAKANKVEEPVDFIADSPKNSPNEPTKTDFVVVFASLLAVVAAQSRRPDGRGRPSPHKNSSPHKNLSRHEDGLRKHVSRQSPNSRGRKRTAQGPRVIQARDRREVWPAILHHQPGWQGCTSLSLRGVVADRAEAGGTLHFQSYEEEVSGSSELLRADGRDGWARPVADAADSAHVSGDQGRSSGDGKLDAPGSSKPGAVSPGDRGRQVHA